MAPDVSSIGSGMEKKALSTAANPPSGRAHMQLIPPETEAPSGVGAASKLARSETSPPKADAERRMGLVTAPPVSCPETSVSTPSKYSRSPARAKQPAQSASLVSSGT